MQDVAKVYYICRLQLKWLGFIVSMLLWHEVTKKKLLQVFNDLLDRGVSAFIFARRERMPFNL